MAGARDTREWFEWFMDMSLHSAYFPSRASMAMKRDFGRDYGLTVITIENGRGKWSSPLAKLEEQGRFVLQRFDEEPGFEEKTWQRFHSATKALDEIGEEVERKELAGMPAEELEALYKRVCNSFYSMWEASIFVDGISIYGEKALVAAVSDARAKTGSRRRQAECLAILTAPTRKSFMAEMGEELNAVAGKRGDGNEGWEKELQELAEKWHWMQNNYLKTERLGKEFFLKLLEETKAGKAFDSEENSRKRNEVFGELPLAEGTRRLAGQVDKYSFFQDERKKYTLKGFGYLDTVLSEIARRTKVALEDLKQMLPAEVAKLLETGKHDADKLKARRSFVIAVFGEEDVQVTEGEGGRKLALEILGEEQETAGLVELHGLGASPGKAVGRVKVLHSSAEVGKVEAGDVLVAGMTEPDYVMALRKAVAIVTDEGGITSHAAVVSREMGIPCVIGTRIATKLFRDGELVEVDANHGVVRKIMEGAH